MKAIGYIRVSTQGQAEEGISLGMQKSKIEAWASLNETRIVGLFADEGASGKDTNRNGLRDAISACKQHKCALVVYSLSRLSRSTLDTLSISQDLEKSGCDLVSLQEKVETTSPSGRVIFRLLAALAEFERETISERTREALRHMKSQGKRVGSVPHGYRLKDDYLVPWEQEQRIIQLVSELRGKGMTLRGISSELARQGAFNRNGKAYNPKSIASILKVA